MISRAGWLTSSIVINRLHRRRTALRAARDFVCVALLSSRLVFAADDALIRDPHEHPPLIEDAELTLPAVLDEALMKYPATLQLEARDAEAQAWKNRGKSWLAGRPSLSLRYQTDRGWVDNNLDEFESGISLPLWRRGARKATQTLGEAMTNESSAAAQATRWEVAGLVRSALWEIALSENDYTLAEEALAVTRRITSSIERRHALGDVALSDVLLARSVSLEAQTALVAAGAAVLDAERAYRSLTTLEARPPFHGEVLSSRQTIAEPHPALALADAEIQRAEKRRAVTTHLSKGAPTLLIGPRFERAAFGDHFDESVGLTINMPFGGSAHAATAITSVGREVANALAAREQHRRKLNLAMHEAAHTLEVVKVNLAAARARAELVTRHVGMGESAYAQGELDLIDLLKLHKDALSAKRDLAQLAIQEKRSTAFYNQAVGEFP